MSKKERFMHASAVFVAALMLLAPLGLGTCIGGEEYENVTPENILGENSFTADYSGMTQISIDNVLIDGADLKDSNGVLDKDNSVITISTPAELVKFSNLVNGDDSNHDFLGYTMILTDNIDLSETTFVPIGNFDKRFNGTFDGQEYKISNLDLNISKENEYVYAGLFGCIGTNGTVKNVGIVDSSINVTATAKVDTESLNDVTIYTDAGGIAGQNEGTIENCYSTANVTVTAEAIDESETYTATSNLCVGGIAGLNGGTIQNCYNTGNVSATATYVSCIGGIVGSNYIDSDAIIQNCYNTGDVTASASGEDSYAYAGGIAGQNNATTIQNCYNTGDMTSDRYAGGIAGQNYIGAISNCYNTGDVSTDWYLGGIVGWNFGGTIENCYFSSSEEGVGGGPSGGCSSFDATTGEITATDDEKRKQLHAVLNMWVLEENQKSDTPKYYFWSDDACPVFTETSLVPNDKGIYEISMSWQMLCISSDMSGEYKLLNNINLGGEWVPIGSRSNQFTGTFDGQEYKISNLYLNISKENEDVYAGLFACIGADGTVKNVGIVDSSIDVAVTAKIDAESTGSASSVAYMGSIVGHNEGTIENCYSTANVTVTVEAINDDGRTDIVAISYAYAGGIAGESEGTIQNCYNAGDVTATAISTSSVVYVEACAGGIAGVNDGTIENCYNTGNMEANGSNACAGGIVGGNGERTQNCYNTGDVNSDSYAGGIAGWNWKTIQNCYNTGNISISTSGEDYYAYAGGIAGWNYRTIQNCYNTGNISASTSGENSYAYAGGITGYNYGTISNCYNTGDVTAKDTYDALAGGIVGRDNYGTISNCYNTGDVSASTFGNDSDAWAGGITGYGDGSVLDCYNTGDVNASTSSVAYAGGITGCSDGSILNCYNIGNVTSNDSAGGIVGVGDGTISNCYNAGDVSATSSFYACAGGIAGENVKTISNCYNTGDVNASTSSVAYAGGIVGWSYGSGTISNCYNTGDVSAIDSSEAYAGGITGHNIGPIKNCYNTGDVIANASSNAYAGGIAGSTLGVISNCYNIGTMNPTSTSSNMCVGGIAGSIHSGISNTFYANDGGILGTFIGDVEGTIGLAKNEMIGLCLFSEEHNINVDGVWSPDLLGINNGFPILADVPLSLTNSGFQSPVYILIGAEINQVDNFLKLSYTGKSTISAAIMPELQGDFEIKYQWYMYDKESNTFNEIEGAVNNTYTLPNDSSFNKYFVKVTFSNESGESTYASFTRDVQLLDDGYYAVEFDADVVVKDSNGNVISPSDGTYILENGKYTYSAVVDDKTIKNSFTVSSSDMFVSVEDSTNTLYYAIVVVIVILVLIAVFYFIRKK